MSGREAPIDLTVPPMDDVVDLHGDPCAADLVLFMNGNQFMAMDDVVAAFYAENPEVAQVFFETIPPGKLVEQTLNGRLQIGNLVLSVRPDVVAAGPRALRRLVEQDLLEDPQEYTSNDLAILVSAGNPLGIRGWADLARPEVRVAMPNLQFEGVAELIAEAVEKGCGPEARRTVFEDKAREGSTRFTDIHHRESARWLADGEVDACPVWSTEARYHCEVLGADMETVSIPDEENVVGRYALAVVRDCAHPEAARQFVDFMVGGSGREVYRKYGFAPPVPAQV